MQTLPHTPYDELRRFVTETRLSRSEARRRRRQAADMFRSWQLLHGVPSRATPDPRIFNAAWLTTELHFFQSRLTTALVVPRPYLVMWQVTPASIPGRSCLEHLEAPEGDILHPTISLAALDPEMASYAASQGFQGVEGHFHLLLVWDTAHMGEFLLGGPGKPGREGIVRVVEGVFGWRNVP